MENTSKTIDKYYDLSTEAKHLLLDRLESFEIKKGEELIPYLTVSAYIYFIETGALKNHHYDELGNKNVVWFGFEGDVSFSVSAYFDIPYFHESVEAFEDCLLYRAPIGYFRKLMQENMEWAQWGRIAIEGLALQLIMEIDKHRPLNAQEKYQSLITDNANIKTRASKKDIASYLGLNPVTISRFK